MTVTGLYAAKPWFTRRLAPLEEALAARGVSPDTLTAAGVAAGWAAGAVLALGALLDAPLLWLAASPLGIVRLAANALDGALARRVPARAGGAVTNEVGDRLADAGLLAGVAVAASPALAAGALAASLAASLAGVLALALTGARDCGGPFGKSERVLALGVGATAAGLAGAAQPISVAATVVLVGGVFTAGARVRRLHRALAPAGSPR